MVRARQRSPAWAPTMLISRIRPPTMVNPTTTISLLRSASIAGAGMPFGPNVLLTGRGRFFDFRANSTPEDYVAEARRHPMFEVRPRGLATSPSGS